MAAFFVRPTDCVRNSEIYFIILSFSVWIAPIMNGNRHLCPDFFFFSLSNRKVHKEKKARMRSSYAFFSIFLFLLHALSHAREYV